MEPMHVVDLSEVAGDRQNLGDIHVAAAHNVLAHADTARALHVCHAHLTSLVVAPSWPLADLVQQVTVLQVTHNALTSLHGVEAFVSLEILNLSHNCLHVIDAHSATLLRQLHRLHEVDLSYNQICIVDLMPSTLRATRHDAGWSSRDHSVDDAFMHITSVNLAHNALLEVPDMRCMPALQILNMGYNKLEEVADVENKLPLLGLRTLHLQHNYFSSVGCLVPVAALAQTLQHVNVYGNAFSNTRSSSGSASAHGGAEKAWWWRPFLLWLVPLLQTVDGMELTESERLTAQHLFRERSGLSKNLIELLNVHRRSDLEEYLRKQCYKTLPPANVEACVWRMEEADEEDQRTSENGPRSVSNDASAMPESLARVSPSPFTVAHENDAQGTMGHGTDITTAWGGVQRDMERSGSERAPVHVIVKAMQEKLKTLSLVVETLWREGISRRIFAAIVIQKHMRAVLARRRLSECDKAVCADIRAQLRRLRSPVYYADLAANYVAEKMSAGRDAMALPSQENMTGNATAMQDVLTAMKSLQQVMTTMWSNLDELRDMSVRERRRAALTIQRHFRGYLARKEWKVLKVDYNEFVCSLVPYVGLIQRVGRSYKVRKEEMAQRAQRVELKRLQAEVRQLQLDMQDMQAMMKQVLRHQRLDRYDDPCKAMDTIITNFTAGSKWRGNASGDLSTGDGDTPTSVIAGKKDNGNNEPATYSPVMHHTASTQLIRKRRVDAMQPSADFTRSKILDDVPRSAESPPVSTEIVPARNAPYSSLSA